MKAQFTSLRSGCRYEIEAVPNAFNGHNVYIHKHGGMSGCYIGEAVLVYGKERRIDVNTFGALVTEAADELAKDPCILKFN